MNRTFVLIAALLASVGFVVSVVGDLLNLYTVLTSGVHVVSHTLSLLWLLTLIFALQASVLGANEEQGVFKELPK